MAKRYRGLRIAVDSDGADLESLADKLLLDSGDLGITVYSELQLTRQDVRHEKADSMETLWSELCGNYDSVDDVIIESAWADIVAGAKYKHIDPDTLQMIEMKQKKFTYAEIAEIFGMPESTVKSRILRAEKRILKMPEFGMWETINDMTKWVSNWLKIFGDEIASRNR